MKSNRRDVNGRHFCGVRGANYRFVGWDMCMRPPDKSRIVPLSRELSR